MGFFYNYYYVQKFRNLGVDLFGAAKQWLKWGEITNAIFYGSVAKLSFLPQLATVKLWGIDFAFVNSLEVWHLVILNVAYAYFTDILNISVGLLYYKKGFLKKEQEINLRDEKLSPFNKELVDTLNNICNKLGIKSEFHKDYGKNNGDSKKDI